MKVITILVGLQGITRVYALSDSEIVGIRPHTTKEKLTLKKLIEPGKRNIQFNSLVDRDKIILSPLYIKFRMRNFGKDMNREREVFKYFGR